MEFISTFEKRFEGREKPVSACYAKQQLMNFFYDMSGIEPRPSCPRDERSTTSELLRFSYLKWSMEGFLKQNTKTCFEYMVIFKTMYM